MVVKDFTNRDAREACRQVSTLWVLYESLWDFFEFLVSACLRYWVFVRCGKIILPPLHFRVFDPFDPFFSFLPISKCEPFYCCKCKHSVWVVMSDCRVENQVLQSTSRNYIFQKSGWLASASLRCQCACVCARDTILYIVGEECNCEMWWGTCIQMMTEQRCSNHILLNQIPNYSYFSITP